LKEKVRDHFNHELTVDPDDVIDKFVDLAREDKGQKKRQPRTSHIKALNHKLQ
jgi:hypothetical protein